MKSKPILFMILLIALFCIQAAPLSAQQSIRFINGYTELHVTRNEVILYVCADNIVPGTTVYAVAYRNAVPNANQGAAFWARHINASSSNLTSPIRAYQSRYAGKCVRFGDMDGPGPTYSGVSYFTQASLNNYFYPTSGFGSGPLTGYNNVRLHYSTSCLVATNYIVACDGRQSP